MFVQLGMLNFELNLLTTKKCWFVDYLALKYLLLINTKYVLRLQCGVTDVD